MPRPGHRKLDVDNLPMIKITETIDMTRHTTSIGIVTVEPQNEFKPFDYYALWNELHTEVRTAEQFEAWVKRVPSFGCSCASWLKDYLAKNPLPDGDLAEYGWTLHNSVNAKLGKPEFSWAEFETKYG